MTNTTEPSAVRELIANAYHAGAMAVHKDWMEREPSGALLDNHPEFGEAAGDYANSIDLAALSASPAPSLEEDLIAISKAQVEELVADCNGLKEAAKTALKDMEWIGEQSNMFFAECSQAEEVVGRAERAARALSAALHGASQ